MTKFKLSAFSSRSAEERALSKIFQNAIDREKANRDPHIAWHEKMQLILSEQKTIRGEADRISNRLQITLPTLRVQIGWNSVRVAPGKYKETPIYSTSLLDIQDRAKNEIRSRSMAFGANHSSVKSTRKYWADRERELKKLLRQRGIVFRKSGYTALNKKAERLLERWWALQDKICLTRARTIDGVKVQASVVARMLGEQGSGWAKDQDVKAARNIASTLSNLARAA